MTRQFQFSPGGTLLAGLGFVFLGSLGFWQLDRAAQKRTTLESFDNPGRVMQVLPGTGDNPDRYTPISLQGSFLDERQVIMDGLSNKGRPGYMVLTPFQPAGSKTILMVNRGWRPWTGPRDQVDGLDIDGGTRQLEGRTDRFWKRGMVLGEGNAAEAAVWPRLSVYPQHEELESWLETELFTWQLLLDDHQDGGFKRDWRPATIKPVRHIGYAVQWFALALTVVIIYLVLSFNNPGHQAGERND